MQHNVAKPLYPLLEPGQQSRTQQATTPEKSWEPNQKPLMPCHFDHTLSLVLLGGGRKKFFRTVPESDGEDGRTLGEMSSVSSMSSKIAELT
jgi:hypothetical protein